MDGLEPPVAALLVGIPGDHASIAPASGGCAGLLPASSAANAGAKSILTPPASGAAYGVVFPGAGVADRSPYRDSSDGVLSLGVGVEDPVLTVGLQVTTAMSDVSEPDNFLVSFKLHRYLGAGTAIAVGGWKPHQA